jgi:hypothetical protein
MQAFMSLAIGYIIYRIELKYLEVKMLAKSPHLTVRDNQANIVNTASIEVFESGTTNAVTVFSDSAGQSELLQPFAVTSKGVIQFYAEGGLYDVKITNDGDVTIVSDVQIGNSQSKDILGDGQDVLTTIYQEQPSEPTSSNVVWVEGYLEPRPSIFAWGRAKALQIDIGDDQPVAWTPRDHGDITMDSTLGRFVFEANGKIVTVANKNTASVLVEMEPDFSNLTEIDSDIREFSETDRGVLFVSQGDLKQLNSDLTISTLCTGLPLSGTPRIDESGLFVVNANAVTIGVYDVSGANATELRVYDATSESPNGDVEDAFYNYGKVYFKGVEGTFDKTYYYFDVPGTDSAVLTGSNAAFIGTARQKNGVIALPFNGTFAFTDGPNAFLFGDDDNNSVVDYIISFDGTNVVFVSPGNDAIEKYDITTGLLVDSITFPSATTKKTGDKIYSIGDSGTTISIFDESSFTVTEYSYNGYDVGTTAVVSFTDALNPKLVSKVSLNGTWVEVANNNLVNGLLPPDILGQDLSKIDQNHPAYTESALYLSTSHSANGYLGSSSVTLGESLGAKGSGSVAIGAGSNVTEYNGIAIGEAEAFGYSAVAIGDGAESYGSESVAIGIKSEANLIESVAVGSDAEAQGDYTVAIGANTEAESQFAIAIGYESDATNTGTIAVGRFAQAINNFAVAVGHEPIASSVYSIAFGYQALASGENSVTIGKNASDGGNLNSVALGADTQVSSPNSVAIGDRQLEVQGDKGFKVQSPDGQQWDVTVDNSGNLVVTAFNVA